MLLLPLGPAIRAKWVLSFRSSRGGWVVSNNGNTALRVGFSQNGVTATNAGNYLTIAGGGVTDRLELKVTEIWLSGSNSVSVMAGLTGIETSNINNQTMSPDGTNWSGSVNAVVG